MVTEPEDETLHDVYWRLVGDGLTQLEIAEHPDYIDAMDRETPWPFSSCRRCHGRVGFVNCPTGSWWAHDVHPQDGHDAEPRLAL